MNHIIIRDAQLEDAARLLEIYAYYVKKTAITFEYEVPSLAEFVDQNRKTNTGIPRDFLVNHISGSFVEMVLWWIRGRRKQTPEELDRYFRAVIEPIL